MQGSAFLGRQAREPREYIYGFRDRMDERYDMLRCVRDKRYKYIRNYMPHLPWFRHQFLDYQAQMPTMQVWQRLADEGKLTGPAALFMRPTKPMEELYDTQADPWEVRNLAADEKHADTLARMRREHVAWMKSIRDLGLLPEADLRTRFGEVPPYTAVRADPDCYPMDRILQAADLADRMNPANVDRLSALLKDTDPAVRYWGAIGLVALKTDARPAGAALEAALKDPAPTVRLTAAEALCHLGAAAPALPVLADGLRDKNQWVSLYAANILDRLDETARPLEPQMKQVRRGAGNYVARALDHAISGLGG
jgi:N-sulfoglucosamine sulfohydrolase